MRRRIVQIALVLSMFVALWWNQEAGLKAVATETHGALCTLKADIRIRRDTAKVYLKEHPRGVVSPATNAVIITPAEIQRGIDNQNSTLRALSDLDCP